MTVREWVEQLLVLKECQDFDVGIECCEKFISLNAVNIDYMSRIVKLEDV